MGELRKAPDEVTEVAVALGLQLPQRGDSARARSALEKKRLLFFHFRINFKSVSSVSEKGGGADWRHRSASILPKVLDSSRRRANTC